MLSPVCLSSGIILSRSLPCFLSRNQLCPMVFWVPPPPCSEPPQGQGSAADHLSLQGPAWHQALSSRYRFYLDSWAEGSFGWRPWLQALQKDGPGQLLQQPELVGGSNC